jgi:preprotein translocase subunit SecB
LEGAGQTGCQPAPASRDNALCLLFRKAGFLIEIRKTTMAEATPDPVFQIQRVYLKDVSLEQPNSPEILLKQEQPAVDIQLGVDAKPIAEGLYEVSVTATVHTKIEDQTVFLVEAKQAGIFEIRNMPEEQLNSILGIACPQIVYPYLRGNVADVIQRGGFPPVNLAEINFQAMYEQQREAAATAEAAASEAPQIIV